MKKILLAIILLFVFQFSANAQNTSYRVYTRLTLPTNCSKTSSSTDEVIIFATSDQYICKDPLAVYPANWQLVGGGSDLSGSGVNTRVAFWNGTKSLTSDSGFIFDSVNKDLAVGRQLTFQFGTITPLSDLPTLTLRRFSAGQANYILQMQDESNNFLAGFNAVGGLQVSSNILPVVAGVGVVGSTTFPFASITVGSSSSARARILGTFTGQRTFNIADANSNSVIPTTAAANNFANGIDAGGNILYAQPAFSNLSGNIAVSQMNSGTNASISTFWRGDGTWAIAGITNSAGNNVITKSNGTNLVGSLLSDDGTNVTLASGKLILGGTTGQIDTSGTSINLLVATTSRLNYNFSTSNAWSMNAPLVFTTDNASDIGASGATRPRSIYVGTSETNPLIIGGTATTSPLTFRATSGVGTTGADIIFQGGSNGATEFGRMLNAGNFKWAGIATRATTEGTNHIDIFNGTAPVGTLTNGISLYSTAGELRVMDSAGNATLLSPHDREGNWIHDEVNYKGRKLHVDMERLVLDLDKALGGGYVKFNDRYTKYSSAALIVPNNVNLFSNFILGSISSLLASSQNIGGTQVIAATPGTTVTLAIDATAKEIVASETAAQNQTIVISGTPQDGTRMTIIITNDASLVRTITMGSGISASATIVGTLSKKATISFVALNGTFIETSRTLGI